MKTIYSPQLNQLFNVVDENNSAYITEQGAYLSKKMAYEHEQIVWGSNEDLLEINKSFNQDFYD